MKTKLILLLLFLVTELCQAQKLPSLIPYRKGDLWGFSDSTGRILVRPQFDKPGRGEGDFGFVDYYDSAHFIYNKDGRLLYKSANDSLVDSLADRGIEVSRDPEHSTKIRKLKMRYTYFRPVLEEGSIIVGNYSHSAPYKLMYGVIDTSGKILYPIKNELYQLRQNSICFANNNEFTDYFDFKGNFAYKYVSGKEIGRIVQKGHFLVENGTPAEGIKVVYNKTGKIIVPDTFQESTMWLKENGRYAIITLYINGDHQYGIIDTTGKLVLPFASQELIWAGSYGIWEISDKVILKDLNGHILKLTKFGTISPVEGLQGESKNFFWGGINFGNKEEFWLIDKNGNTLSKKGFQLNACLLNEGIIPVLKYNGSMYQPIGAIDTAGGLVIPFHYFKPIFPFLHNAIPSSYFHNGLMKVIYHNKEIYIDRYNRRYNED